MDVRVNLTHDRLLLDLVSGMDKWPCGMMCSSSCGCPNLTTSACLSCSRGTHQERILIAKRLAGCPSLITQRLSPSDHGCLQSFCILPSRGR